uniref:Uncharacterized protein n=1 Tax=Romanomermis culicivorax TaxID=13658 RepID=A0A915JBC0_ROMCU
MTIRITIMLIINTIVRKI